MGCPGGASQEAAVADHGFAAVAAVAMAVEGVAAAAAGVVRGRMAVSCGAWACPPESRQGATAAAAHAAGG